MLLALLKIFSKLIKENNLHLYTILLFTYFKKKSYTRVQELMGNPLVAGTDVWLTCKQVPMCQSSELPARDNYI